jgi:hypothetical protein
LSAITHSSSGFVRFPRPSGSGISDAAHSLADRIFSLEKHQTNSPSSKIYELVTQKEIRRIALDCADSNWGGNHEAPISMSALAEAKSFLENLPIRFQKPDVVPEPNGSIAFEWSPKPFRFVILNFSGGGFVSFASAANRENAQSGFSRVVGNEIPKMVMDMLQEIHNHR